MKRFLFTLCAAACIFSIACAKPTQRVTLQVNRFTAVDNNLVSNVHLMKASANAQAGTIVYSIDPKIKDKVHFTVNSEGLLTCRMDDIKKAIGSKNIDMKDHLSNVDIYVYDKLDEVILSGVGDINIDPDLIADDAELKLNGVGNMNVSAFQTEDFEATLNGVGNICFKGNIIARKAELKLAGVGDIKFDNKSGLAFKCDDIYVTMSALGNCNLNSIKANMVTAKLSGVGNINLKGQTVEAKLVNSSMGNIKCGQLIADIVNANSSGMGSIECNALKSITAYTSNMGSITCLNTPGKYDISGNVKIKN